MSAVSRVDGVLPPPARGRVGEGVSRFARTREMTRRARGLRREPTIAEQKLWSALRRGQLGGLSFRRQHPVGACVLDFYCPPIGLAIELDGGQHAFKEQSSHDDERTQWLSAKDILVLRFWNNDVIENLTGVLEGIVGVAEARAGTPSPTLPLSGGGEESAAPGEGE